MIGRSKARTPSTDINGLRVPTMNFEHFLSLYVNQSLKNCLSASLPQRQIQLVVVLISPELKLSHLVIFNIICSFIPEVTLMNSACFVLFVSLYMCPVYHSLSVSVRCATVTGHLALTLSC